MKKLSRLAVLAAALVSPALAQAQGSSAVAFGAAPGERLVSLTTLPTSTNGQLVVGFHGDPATGCALRGLCGYSGTIVLSPGDATIALIELRHRRHITYQASFLPGFGDQATTTLAHVDRAGGKGTAGLCADAQQPNSLPASISHGGLLTLALVGRHTSILSTRCAGPLDADVASAAPTVLVPVKRLLKGHLTLRLSGTRAFAANGFAGTVSSTVVIHVGAPDHQGGLGSASSNRTQTVTERFSLVRQTGQLVARVRGSASPVFCQPLDSCGISGTITIHPRFVGALATLTAAAYTRRPYRDMLAALGVSRQGNPRGIQVYGSIMSTQAGVVTADLTQPGPCVDSARLEDGTIGVFGHGGAFGATFVAPSLRTRCPGPSPLLASLALARFSRGVLDRREITLTFRPMRSFTDDGYVASMRGSITLVLRQGRVIQHVP
jgi:hypothetical protein